MQMARMVATKTALSTRIDALADPESRSSDDAAAIGLDARASLERRLGILEQGLGIQSVRSKFPRDRANQRKVEMTLARGQYNPAADVLMIPAAPAAVATMNGAANGVREEAEVVTADAVRPFPI